jgi:thiol-disulfide isomerase/thioredoxin
VSGGSGVTRRQVVGFAVVLALLAGAFVVQAVRAGRDDDPARADLVGLRAEARLDPCPSGLGRELPDLVLPCLGGGDEVRLRDPGPGRPLLVNAWGSWCEPCRREVPALVALRERAAGKVDVVGVLTQDDLGKGLEFSRDFGIRYPSLVDDDGAFFRTFSKGPPVTAFVTADGRVTHVELGEVTDVEELVALVRRHLGVAL